MQTYLRKTEEKLKRYLFKGKVVILYGPRQVGKTTLVKKLAKEFDGSYFLCEEPDVREALTNKTSTEMFAFLKNKKFVILDEAQKIENIGTVLKLLIDTFPSTQFLATGSSSFDLANKINEPLTGRNYEVMMYPLSLGEIIENKGVLETKRLLDNVLVYGTYPGVFESGDLQEENIKKIASDYLFKDILSYDKIRKPDILLKILRALAFQVGKEVRYSELAGMIGENKLTIQSYVSILEKAFIVFKLKPLTKNGRDEIKLFDKIYFYDNGILSSLLQNFNLPELRKDKGELLENFFVSEMIKKISYENLLGNSYFWRKKQGGEIDYIFETAGKYYAYECKYSKDKVKLSANFQENYRPESFKVVNRKNIVDILM